MHILFIIYEIIWIIIIIQIWINHWYHIVYVFNNGENKIYVDGQLKGTSSSNSINIGNGRDLYFGKFSDYWFPLDGSLDDIRIYNRVLLESEIQALYNE